MGSACVLSRAQVGLVAPLVRVEVHVGSGLPQFSIVGLPAPVVRESKDRVRAALASGGYDFPAGRLTVNLAPAELPKEGGRYDLPIALGILLASDQLRTHGSLADCEFYGELGLTGGLKPVQGLLLAALQAEAEGHRLCAPRANAPDLALAAGRGRWLAADLAEVVARVEGRGEDVAESVVAREGLPGSALALPGVAAPDLADVRGQIHAKRALVIAAAGGHHVLLSGPPGAGKSLLAQRLPGLLPPLSASQHREVAAIHALHSDAGARLASARPPYRAPHHTSSAYAIVGGGPRIAPGEISLAHHGVLFLDELPEFDRRVLEGLREPLETGAVCIARAGLQATYPAEFQLIAAMNPCPAGCLHERGKTCACTPPQKQRYRSRLSGPLLDRIDIQVRLERVEAREWLTRAAPDEQSSAQLAPRVGAARERQHRRQGCLNARLRAANTLAECRLEKAALRALEAACEHYNLSARSGHRLARVARSIADLEGEDTVSDLAVREAAQLRLILGLD